MKPHEDLSGRIRLATDPETVDPKAVSDLLDSVGMGPRDPEQIRRAISASNAVVVAYLDTALVGFGRSISDGEYYCTLWDVAVDAKFQGCGIGNRIVEYLLRSPREQRMRLVGLFTSLHNEAFYSRLGFTTLHSIHAMTMNPSHPNTAEDT